MRLLIITIFMIIVNVIIIIIIITFIVTISNYPATQWRLIYSKNYDCSSMRSFINSYYPLLLD